LWKHIIGTLGNEDFISKNKGISWNIIYYKGLTSEHGYGIAIVGRITYSNRFQKVPTGGNKLGVGRWLLESH